MDRTTVGARELKTRLGTYLRRVREGQTLLVTDRGEPIAELRPIQPATDLPAALQRLSRTRGITLPLRQDRKPFRPIALRGRRTLADAIATGREETP